MMYLLGLLRFKFKIIFLTLFILISSKSYTQNESKKHDLQIGAGLNQLVSIDQYSTDGSSNHLRNWHFSLAYRAKEKLNIEVGSSVYFYENRWDSEIPDFSLLYRWFHLNTLHFKYSIINECNTELSVFLGGCYRIGSEIYNVDKTQGYSRSWAPKYHNMAISGGISYEYGLLRNLRIGSELTYFYNIMDEYNYFNYSRNLRPSEFRLNKHNLRISLKAIGVINLSNQR